MNIKTAVLALAIAGLIGCGPKEQTPGDVTTPSSVTPAAVPNAPPATSESARSSSADAPTTALLNTYWKLVGLNGKDVAVADNQREPHLVFGSDEQVSGSDGCNRMMGSYSLSGDNLSFGQLAGTKMACMEGGEQAQEFAEVLSKITRYRLQGEYLDLLNNEGNSVARFTAGALP